MLQPVQSRRFLVIALALVPLSKAKARGTIDVDISLDEQLHGDVRRRRTQVGEVADKVPVADGEVAGVDLSAAKRTSRVDLQPSSNAVEMEDVPALGQEPEHIRVGEVGEADGALEPLLRSFEGGEPEERERLHHRLVDAGEPRRWAGGAVWTAAGGGGD